MPSAKQFNGTHRKEMEIRHQRPTACSHHTSFQQGNCITTSAWLDATSPLILQSQRVIQQLPMALETRHLQAILQNLLQSLLLLFAIFSLALCGRFQLLQEASINRWIGRFIKVEFLERSWLPLLKRTIQLVEDVSHDAISKVICLDDYSLLSPQEQRLDKVKGREIVCASENGCDRLVILTWSNLEIDFSVSAL